MSSIFPNTSVTLLHKIAVERTGGGEEEWARFFELYYPAMCRYVEMKSRRNDAEDVVQDVLVKLVDALRHGRYRAIPGVKFRSYLARLLYNELVSRFRKDQARGGGAFVPVDGLQLPVEADAALPLDLAWRAAARATAVEHVLTKTALSAQSKAIYRAYAVEERPIDEVAAAFGTSRNNVSQVKSRVDRMVAAVEEKLAGEVAE